MRVIQHLFAPRAEGGFRTGAGRRSLVAGQEPLTRDHSYVFNRSAAIQRFPFPGGLEPDLTVSLRGFTQAWVYRGDRLQASSYQFPK